MPGPDPLRRPLTSAKDPLMEAVDETGHFIDKATGSKYHDKIAKGKEAAKSAVPTEQTADIASEPEPDPAD